MKINRIYLLFFLVVGIAPITGFTEEDSIALIDVQSAFLSTEASKQAFEELRSSKEWKEVYEELQLKMNEVKEIQEKAQKEGPTMSDEEKMEAQKRLRSLGQDAQFLNQKLEGLQAEVMERIQKEQSPKFSKVVTELMNAKGIKIILNRQAVLAFDPKDTSVDLTPDVVELLNQND